jgi:transposase
MLEDDFEVVVGNAGHIKNVPGRKTDVKDAEWIADLLRHGLIRPSFVPPLWQRRLRELVRYRRKLVESQASERNRVLKLLEMGNIKLSSLATNVFGASGRAMIRALIEGNASPREMAELALGSLRKKVDTLSLALDGHLTLHQRQMLRLQYERVLRTEADIAQVDGWISEVLEPYEDVLARLKTIPGVDHVGAVTIVAELGVDMNVFPTDGHAAAWAGVSPANHESAGKRKYEGKRRGNVHLATALVQAAASASRKKNTYLKDKFWRLKARRGHKRALVAIAHHILIAAYHMLKRSTDYKDLAGDYLERRRAKGSQRYHVKQLESLGYVVSLQPQPAVGVS